MKPPNIIFIVLDSLRADRVFASLDNIYLTPFLKTLLENSIYFENCISNYPWTLPAHMCMFTGLYQTQNALISKDMQKLDSKIPILSEILKDMGYFTVCFTENAFISKIYGLTRGFDKEFLVWDWNPWIRENFKLSNVIKLLNKIDIFLKKKIKNRILSKTWDHINNRLKKIIKNFIKIFFFKNIIINLKNDTIADLEDFSRHLKEFINVKPLYLFFNFLTAHDPYIPLSKTFKSFNINLKDFKNIKNMLVDTLNTRLDINIKSERLSKNQIRSIKKLYDACVYSSDMVVKKLFSILKILNLLENSYVIITSDHGEHLGDKSDQYLWEHNTYQSLYEPLIKVPLFIYNVEYKKKIVDNQVQLIDIFHTILHLTGIPTSENKYLDIKKSIIYQIENNSNPKYIFGEYINPKLVMLELINKHRRTINKNLIGKIFNDLHFIRTSNNKYIKYNNINAEEYYDLLQDNDEQNNIFNKDSQILKEMKKMLEQFLNIITNPDNIKELLTKKEKTTVDRIINSLKINGL